MKKNLHLLFFTAFICLSFQANALKRQMENLDRGVVAVKTSNGVYISWRLLATDNPKCTFNVYRNGIKKFNLLPIFNSTNVIDNVGSTLDSYTVRTVLNGVEIDTSEAVKPWSDIYKSIPIKRPAAATNASGAYKYCPGDCSVGDVDGDGQYEIILKWDPTNAKDNSQSGYTGNVYLDAYELDGTQLWRIDLGCNIRAGAHYTQFMVYDLDGDGLAEVACKTAPGTIDGQGKFVLMNSDKSNVDYRNTSGYILSGPEYLTVFNGKTGAEINTVAYNPPRGVVGNWGDTYGNRLDRYLACIAYLDGVHPSLVMCRGYYTRTTLAAYDLVGGKLVQRWFHDSNKSGSGAYGQGNHNLTVGDGDNDGKDEIIYGACAINDDGKLLYRTGLGHGDAMHLSDLDPDKPGLEVFEVHEGSTLDYEMHNAGTGAILMGKDYGTGIDNGRGIAADVDARYRGFEMWSGGANVLNCKGDSISPNKPAANFRIYWDADLQDELLDGTKLDKWNGNGTTRLFTIYNYGNAKEVNGTKANPCISADILGDWREEMIYYNSADSSNLILFTTTIFTGNRLFTLMHDPVYRLSIAWQNTAYNQPPHLGFYIGSGLDSITWPDIYTPVYKSVITSINPVQQSILNVYCDKNGQTYIRASEKMESIQVYSLTGVLLYNESANWSEDFSFNIPGREPMMIIRVKTKSGVSTTKIIRQ